MDTLPVPQDYDVVIYTAPRCPYCDRAKMLLKSKDIVFHEYDLGNDVQKREELTKMTNGRKTVPQIFIKGLHIGGCDDLYAFDKAGKLDQIMAVPA